MRVIIHVDMDCFFAAVEIRDNPAIEGKPVIVGAGKRGVVSAASYEARRYGVHSAMPIVQAEKLCPHGVFVVPDHHKYYEASKKIHAIFRRYSPLIEPISVDEAFLDVTGCNRLFGDGVQIGRKIQADIFNEERLSASVGIASCKLLAKVASDFNKPKGFVVVPPGEEAAFLAPLPIKKLWGIGDATAQILDRIGIKTIGDIVNYPEGNLADKIGEHAAAILIHRAKGIDDRPVEPRDEAKSYGHERTFNEDLNDAEKLKTTLLHLTEKAVNRMCDDSCQARTVSIKIRSSDFKTITRSHSVNYALTTVAQVYPIVLDLFKAWNGRTMLRLVGVSLSGIEPIVGSQMQLFHEQDEKSEQIEKTIRDLRQKFGEDAVLRASLLDRKK